MAIARQTFYGSALRILVICAVVACIYYLWAGQPTVSTAIAIGIACVILARLVIRARLFPNPFGETDRDYSVRPVLWGIIKGGVCLSAAFVWGIGCVLAMRYLVIPDTPLVEYGLMGAPFVLLILAGAWFLIASGIRAVYGHDRRGY
ncbi:MAG TPA: hypothetical protein VFB37_03825 [Steroidobacteraceae bacterium]|nr:hypothetical protein [Steroidobacteraceae bacterium]